MKTGHAWLFLLTVAGLNAGCAARPVDLAKTGQITVEEAPSKHAWMTQVAVIQEKGGLVVSGKVRLNSPSSRAITGHVDITLLDESGQALAQLTGRYKPSWMPHHSRIGRRAWAPQQRQRLARFLVQLDHPLKPTLTIRIAHNSRDEATRPGAGPAEHHAGVAGPAVQHDHLDGPADAQHPAVVRPDRAGDHFGADAGQDRRGAAQGQADGQALRAGV